MIFFKGIKNENQWKYHFDFEKCIWHF